MREKTPDFIDLMREDLSSYAHPEPGLTPYNEYLLPTVERILGPANGQRLFEIGFGNGAVAAHLASKGFAVAGIEPSRQGLALAQASYPGLTGLRHGTIYEDLRARFGGFQAVVSLEVIEHLYFPRRLVQAAFALLEPGGVLVLSTIYHGYLKNIATAILGRFDLKMNPLWDHGHIKFFSPRTLTKLLTECGFEDVAVTRPDLIPQFARSMVARGRKPAAP